MPDLNVPTPISETWQRMANALAALIDVPAALIMRVVDAEIAVFVASQTAENPYQPGQKETLAGSGLYCETVLKTQRELHVPNALSDEAWCDNPDIKLDMISYLGLPIQLPNGTPFGTLCVLDKQEHVYSQTQRDLLAHFRDLVESHLGLLQMNHELGEENRSLSDYINELKVLRELIPICSYCKSVRNEEGAYEAVDAYIHRHADANFTHTVCPTCMAEQHPAVYAKLKEAGSV